MLTQRKPRHITANRRAFYRATRPAGTSVQLSRPARPAPAPRPGPDPDAAWVSVGAARA